MFKLSLRVYFYATSRLLLSLAVLLSTAAALAQAVNPFDNNVFAFFSDPVLFGLTVSAAAGWLVELITDALKDRNVQLRGWHTRLVSAGVAAVLAGGGGYFGLSYFTGESGWPGVFAAAHMALGSWLFADVKHRAGQLRRTGARQEVRREIGEQVIDPILTGLLKEAAKLPPPFGIAVSVVKGLYEKYGRDVVLDLINQQRALSEVEISQNQDGWEQAQAEKPKGAVVRPVAE